MNADLRTRLEGLTGVEPDSQPLPHAEPIPRVAPADEGELLELLHWAASEHLRVLPTGQGTRLGALPPIRADLALSTERLTGVVAHEAADGTLTARAGTPLTELADVAASGGHELAPATRLGTLGGALAAGDAGAARLRLGPARDHLLGARLALPSGTAVASGGRLVKNVTGYDLHRLACGARGTTGVLLEATLRLLPRPERTVAVRGTCPSLSTGAILVLDALRGTSPARHARLERTAAGWELDALLGDRAAALDETLDALRLRAAADGIALAVDEREPHLPEARPPTGRGRLVLRTRPSRVLATWERLETLLARHGLEPEVALEPALGELDLDLARVPVEPAVALLGALFDAAADPALRAAWCELPPEHGRSEAERLHAAARRAPRDARDPAAALADRVRRALDPTGACAR